MKFNIKKLTSKSFVRNVIIMTTGTAAAQAVSLALSPIITRLYGPEAYGLMGVFMAIIQIIAPIAALSYPIAIVLPKSDKDAKGLIRLSLYISVVIATIVAIILMFFSQKIVQLFQLEDIEPFLYLIPIVILFASSLQVTEQWLIRTKQFAITAKVSFLQALLLQGSKVGIGFFHPIAAVLIVLTALGNGSKAFLLNLFLRRSNYKSPSTINEESKSVSYLAKVHRDFPLYRAPQVFINGISQNLPILLLTIFFGPASAGFYTIGRTVLGMPTQLIGKSVGDVFYPRITEAGNKGENLTRLIIKATLALGAIGIIPFGTIVIFGPWLFSVVFGADWLTAGEFARWMALWVFFMFINQPSVKSLPVMMAQAFHLKYSIFTIIIRTGALIVGYYLFSSDVIAIAFFSISAAILNIGLILITLQISKNFDMQRRGI
ncbi:polysaccharide biosynthesis protein [Virgibacillus profundi]|uniref:Polysaccharide biosynthesis protein n=1 Tax=Virgibacillus profundi TaxID=2024555 RepID=A0A2A2II93_9BACI|nr:oligosaccharide flippase family protein [Virgibacillus profundi]PAV31088.1 polysaccharide biosynthesis protein [Virgibacillus profundi]PXY55271.1 polysaccharide biosynthesis protein [Virgibacillus profundi]